MHKNFLSRRGKQRIFRDMGEQSKRLEEEEYLDLLTYDWGNNVLNGIAYDSRDDSFLVTGKMWHKAFKVKLDYLSEIEKFEREREEMAASLRKKDNGQRSDL